MLVCLCWYAYAGMLMLVCLCWYAYAGMLMLVCLCWYAYAGMLIYNHLIHSYNKILNKYLYTNPLKSNLLKILTTNL